jgi:hypothetical protein
MISPSLMDKMKKVNQIDDALREVAKQRDKLLKKVALSPARRTVLTEFLVGQFPLEAALRETATKRDELLDPRALEIPPSIESTLHRQLGTAGTPPEEVRGWRGSVPTWLRLFRTPLGSVLTVCALIAGALLCVGSWVTASRHGAENFPHAPRTDIESRVTLESELFTQNVAIGPFNLKTNEPASLQASFFSNSAVYLANASERPLGLRLDLPMKAILTDDGLARTP